MDENTVKPELAIDPSELIPIRMETHSDSIDGQAISVTGRKKITLSDLNIPKPKKKVVSTFFGTFKPWSAITWLERVYLFLSLLSLVASIGVTIERIVTLRSAHTSRPEGPGHSHQLDDTKSDYTFAILLFWTALCAVYHVMVAILCERPYDLVSFMVSSAVVWAYVLINFIKTPNPPVSKLIRLVLSSLFVPFILIVGGFLCHRYLVTKRLIYNTVGANEVMQKMFMTLLIHDSFVKFDIQMGVSVLILWVQKSFIEPHPDTTELIVIGVGTTITVVWGLTAYLAIRLENKNLVYVFYALSWIEPAVVLFNLVRIVELDHNIMSLVVTAYICGVVALISRCLSIYTTYLVTQNFGKGLKKKIFKLSDEETETG